MIAVDNGGQTAVRDIVDGLQEDIQEFGVECDPPLSEEQVHTINVPETLTSLTPTQQQQFLNAIDTSPTRSITEGVDQYINYRDHLNSLL